ncbi:tail fiber assembly protein [Yersinia phage YerA41]|nr:tail fiber assembly protein [Yersinia phage YerA41]
MSTNTEKKYVELDENGFAPENGWIVVYNYTYETKEFIRQSEEYLQIGVGIPAQSTTITPPEAKEGFTAVFDENAKKWTQVEDHRNEVVYDVTNGSQFNITTLGPVDTAKYTTIVPTSQYDEWDGSKWVVNEEKKHAADVAVAESTRTTLYSEADRNIKDLQFAVDLDIATDAEKAELIEWKKYCVYLNRVDTSKAPDITWPAKPTRK